MLEKWAEKIKQRMAALAAARPVFDPAKIGDPLAERIEWTPLKKGGANFRTHKLVKTGERRVEFRATAGAILFCLVFFIVGAGAAVVIPLSRLSGGGTGAPASALVIAVLFGLVFMSAGGAMYYFMAAPVVFDKRLGLFWKGWKSPEHTFDRRSLKNLVELKNVHAIQIVSEYCRGEKNSYYSYEMNLAIEDGGRVNVVDHGNYAMLRQDADVLAKFLDKPVWDASPRA